MKNSLFNEVVKEKKNMLFIAKDKEYIVDLFKNYIDSLIDTKDELVISLIDYENKNYKEYENNEKFFPPIAHQKDDVINMIDYLTMMKNARIALFKKSGVRNIEEYNKKENNKIPYICVMVDEFSYLMGDEQIDKLLELGSNFQYLGIYLIIGSTNDVLTGKPLSINKKVYFDNTNCYVIDKVKKIDEFKNYLFIDIETNGLNEDRDEILKFSYVLADDKLKIKNREEFFINTNNTIIKDAVSSITGITQQDIQQGKDSQFLTELLKKIVNSDTLVMSYNLDFTMGFIKNFLKTNNVFYILDDVHYLDILYVFKSSENFKHYRLKDAIKFYDIKENFNETNDTEICYELFKKMIKMYDLSLFIR